MAAKTGMNFIASKVADGDLSASQYLLVKRGTTTETDVAIASVAGEIVVGVLQNKPQDNEHASVVEFGHTKVLLANSYGPGQIVMTTNAGYATARTAGLNVIGELITGATSGGVGELFYTMAYSQA
jgi:hypothetical protein